MKCPICNNMNGFSFGTCVQCGYNHIDHEYRFIKINTEILKALVPADVYDLLVAEYEKTVLVK